jgi:hypothetical protein
VYSHHLSLALSLTSPQTSLIDGVPTLLDLTRLPLSIFNCFHSISKHRKNNSCKKKTKGLFFHHGTIDAYTHDCSRGENTHNFDGFFSPIKINSQ